APGGGGLAAALGAALLGGLVLNLMPCVLPVLSLKLLGVLGLGGAARAVVRRSFLATAAGILTAFLALGGVLAVLKAGGAAVGWGIQFQQPAFLVAMAFVLVLFACNLWGWFEVPLPRWASAVAAGGGEGDRHGSLAGAFMTGLLATLLATPCSAPFLGTAVGFALSQGTGEILSIFAVLGLGLALPYLGVAALPRLATALPRPGRWMLVLRRVLGVGLLGTAVWLLSVLSAEVAPAAAAVVAALLAAAALALALRPRLPQGARLATPALVALLAAAALVAPGRLGEPAATDGGAPRADAAGAHWRPWDPAAIPGLVAQGNVVFVDVTADWCVTCQVNRRLVLEDAAVAARLGGPGVVTMLADWTRPSEAIAGYLASFGRYGIPFNVVYGPGAPRGIMLPELLSAAAVFDALDRAATARASADAD
ncbi:MAG: thioredoxin family protein, partial [Rhodospirillaceae bacterium]|nr:thioredoxin family protein [Rhodospirillaceae bacterium]